MKKVLTVILSMLLLFLTACGAQNRPTPEPSETGNQAVSTEGVRETPKAAPVGGVFGKFTATDLEGKTVDQSVFSGYNLTMVNIWATFCSPCISEMPDLGELAKEYKVKGVQIVGLVSDVLNHNGTLNQRQIGTAKEIVEKTKADFLHILPSEELFPLLRQTTSVPTTIFVDKHGNQVGNPYIGSNSKEAWKVIIDQALAEVSK